MRFRQITWLMRADVHLICDLSCYEKRYDSKNVR